MRLLSTRHQSRGKPDLHANPVRHEEFVSCCCGHPSGYPTERFPTSQDVLIRGGSCIIGPLGQLVAGPKYDEECILTADIDRAEITRAKFDFDVVGHYSRPDVFRLEVNEQPMRSVTFQ